MDNRDKIKTVISKKRKTNEALQSLCIVLEGTQQTTKQSKEGDLKVRRVILSGIRKEGSEFRESAIARNCGTSSRQEIAKQEKSYTNVQKDPLSLC